MQHAKLKLLRYFCPSLCVEKFYQLQHQLHMIATKYTAAASPFGCSLPISHHHSLRSLDLQCVGLLPSKQQFHLSLIHPTSRDRQNESRAPPVSWGDHHYQPSQQVGPHVSVSGCCVHMCSDFLWLTGFSFARVFTILVAVFVLFLDLFSIARCRCIETRSNLLLRGCTRKRTFRLYMCIHALIRRFFCIRLILSFYFVSLFIYFLYVAARLAWSRLECHSHYFYCRFGWLMVWTHVSNAQPSAKGDRLNFTAFN